MVGRKQHLENFESTDLTQKPFFDPWAFGVILLFVTLVAFLDERPGVGRMTLLLLLFGDFVFCLSSYCYFFLLIFLSFLSRFIALSVS